MSSKSPITCHVLDSSLGKPAAGVQIVIHGRTSEGQFVELAVAETDDDGRCSSLLNGRKINTGVYRITFYVEDYFQKGGRECFYPQVEVIFNRNDISHHHIPLLISPFSYTTYRGS